MLGFVQSHPVAAALTAIALTAIIQFFIKGYKVRSRLHKLPGPGVHSMWFGHLAIMGELAAEFPNKVHPHATVLRLKEKYNIKTGFFYIDVWPFEYPLLYIIDPAIAQQVTVEQPLPKHHTLPMYLLPLTGKDDMVSTNGPIWKKWRSIMNPGFAISHLMTLVPEITDQSVIFTKNLIKHAQKDEVFRLEETATRLTVDIIGKVALDIQLGTQTGENEMVDAFRDQVQLLPSASPLDPFSYYYPNRIWRRWRNDRKMVSYIGQVLDERFARSGAVKPSNNGGKKQRKRAIIDLAMDSYLTQQEGGDAEDLVQHKAPVMDAEFRNAAITQIRTFIFAGHDTTSSTICYALYELSKHPETLDRLREEHDKILGPKEGAAEVIKADPHIINKLEYTNAVIKETLRLWPAASTTRIGDPGSTIHDPATGERYPTDDFLVWEPSYPMHRDKDIWGPTANAFDPTRFLKANEGKLPENAWRPFEKGPRNCIGQELAMLEARIILALTARPFEFKLAIDELDALKNDGSNYAKDDSWRKGKQEILDGEPMYPILIGTAKPREGMPMRVKMV